MDENETKTVDTKINFSVKTKYLYTLLCGDIPLKLYTDEIISGSEEEIVRKLLLKTLKKVYTFDVDRKDSNKIIFYNNSPVNKGGLGYYFEVTVKDKKFLEELFIITNVNEDTIGCLGPINIYNTEDLVDLFMEYFYKI